MTQPDCIRHVRTPLSSAVLFYNCDHQPFALSPSPTFLFLVFLLHILFLSLLLHFYAFLSFPFPLTSFCCSACFISFAYLCFLYHFLFLSFLLILLFVSSLFLSVYFSSTIVDVHRQKRGVTSHFQRNVFETQKYYQMYVKIYLTELMFISRYTKHSELV